MTDLIQTIRAQPRAGPYLTAHPGIRSDRNDTCELIEQQPPTDRQRLARIVEGEVRAVVTVEDDPEGGRAVCLWEHAPPRGLTIRRLHLPDRQPKPSPAAPQRASGGRWCWLLAGVVGLGLGAGLALFARPQPQPPDDRIEALDRRLAEVEALLRQRRPVTLALSREDRDTLQRNAEAVTSLSAMLKDLRADLRAVEVWIVRPAPKSP